MPRSYYRDAPPTPLRSAGRGGSTIADLWMAIGNSGARAAEAQGDIWGNAIQSIGQNVTGAIQQHQTQTEQREATRRLAMNDAAATRFISAWDGQDSQQLLAGLSQIKGPVEGPKMAQAVLAFRDLDDKNDERNLARLRTMAESAAKMELPQFEAFYPALQTKAPAIEQGFGLPAGTLKSLRETSTL